MRRFSKCRHAASIQRKLSAPLRNPRLCLSERSTIFGAARVTPSVGMTAGANLPKSQAPAIPQAEQPSLTDWTAPDLCFGVIFNWARTKPKRLKKSASAHGISGINPLKLKKSDVRIGDLAFINKYPGSDGNHVGICVGFLKNGEPLIAHCSATQNKVVVSTCGSEFKYFRRPCSVLTAN